MLAMYLCILTRGRDSGHRNMQRTDRSQDHCAYRENLSCASMHLYWYWLADCVPAKGSLCPRACVYMKAIHVQGQNDKIDAQKIAVLTRRMLHKRTSIREMRATGTARGACI